MPQPPLVLTTTITLELSGQPGKGPKPSIFSRAFWHALSPSVLLDIANEVPASAPKNRTECQTRQGYKWLRDRLSRNGIENFLLEQLRDPFTAVLEDPDTYRPVSPEGTLYKAMGVKAASTAAKVATFPKEHPKPQEDAAFLFVQNGDGMGTLKVKQEESTGKVTMTIKGPPTLCGPLRTLAEQLVPANLTSPSREALLSCKEPGNLPSRDPKLAFERARTAEAMLAGLDRGWVFVCMITRTEVPDPAAKSKQGLKPIGA